MLKPQKTCTVCSAPSTSKRCKPCDLAYKRQKHLEWRTANRDHVRTKSRTQMAEWRKRMPQEQADKFRRQMADRAIERREELKIVVYGAYGGFKCACCGETERKFLSLDHVNNDGYTMRAKFGQPSGEPMLRWLQRNGYPEGFQVLCMNCNHGKSRNGGICPHQAKKV